MERNPVVKRRARALQKIFAANVLVERNKLGLTQDELADRCGYHRTYIGSIERGERNATLATIEAFAVVFGVAACSLLVDPYDR
jgi:transcriptional regulator with XRE-family HTH domain